MALRRLVFSAVVLILAWTAAAVSAPGPARRPGKGMVAAFLPIGASSERVAAVAENFRTELALEIAVLPPMEPEASATDQRRKQLVGERLIQQIYTAHRQLLSHGKVVLIGITDRDMLTSAQAKTNRSTRANQTSSFALSVRNPSSSIAVVSTFRMDPRNLGAGINDEVLQARLRKMVAKHVGLMLYGLPASKDPHSLLFSGISGAEQLDFVDARFESSGLLPAQGSSNLEVRTTKD